jgi:HEAT repeat protein
VIRSNSRVDSGKNRKEELLGKITATITELSKGLKAINFYPPEHPSLNKILSHICEIIEDIPPPEEGLEIHISKESLTFKNMKIPEKHLAIKDLRTALFVRRSNKLIILPGITVDDLAHFLRAISEDPSELTRRGGLETILIENQVSHIWVNKVDYERLTEELKKDKEDRKTVGDHIHIEDDPLDLGDQFIRADTVGFMAEDAAVREESLEALLERLSKTTSPDPYRDLVVRVSRKINELKGHEHTISAEKALKIYTRHFEYPPGGDEEIKRLAITGIKEIGSESVIESSVRKFCSKSIQERAEAEIVLWVLGEKSTSKLIEVLTDEMDLMVRKAIVDLIIKIGEKSVPEIVKHLEDKRWYVVRNMVTILGGMKNADVASYIASTLSYPDPRVKKEAIKALSRVQSPLSIVSLGECCFDPDEDVATLAITALGTKKDEKAVEILHERFLTKKFIFPDYYVTKNIIEALRNIGSDAAVDVLRYIALYNPFIKPRKVKALKILAVLTIGKMKTKRAQQILEELSKSSDTICRKEASKLLKRKGQWKE